MGEILNIQKIRKDKVNYKGILKNKGEYIYNEKIKRKTNINESLEYVVEYLFLRKYNRKEMIKMIMYHIN